MGVARRGVELGMSEQNLDHTNIDVLLEQVQEISLTRPEAIRAMMETILHILSKDRGEKPPKAKRK